MSSYRLAQLNIAVMKEPRESPTKAFNLRNAFVAPDAAEPGAAFAFDAECPAT